MVSLHHSIACNQNIDETVSTVLSKVVADIRSKWKKKLNLRFYLVKPVGLIEIQSVYPSVSYSTQVHEVGLWQV